MDQSTQTSSREPEQGSEPRRGTGAAEEAYLRIVGERVRLERARRGMSRKALSQTSGVSERYLAELERGTGNASLLVLREIAAAMALKVTDLVSESPERSLDLSLIVQQLEQLPQSDLPEARRMLTARFGRPAATSKGRIALIGLRGAGKSTLGQDASKVLGIPFVELDREIERASGMEVAEIFAVHGQSVFRKLEQECLESVVDAHGRVVIAAGGGIVTSPDAFELLLSSCFVVWVKATPESHIDRAVQAGDLRPAAASRRALAEFRQILDDRAPLYARADATIDTSDKTSEEALALLIRLIHEHNGVGATGGRR